jgi:ATP-dependent Clp protease ATP-binding subunit ClpB
VQQQQRMLKEEVDEEDVAEVVAKWTGVPVTRLLEGEIEKLVKMEERLRARVIGQDEALKVVSEAVRRARAGLQDPSRPIGSFLFLGPTGVGKTETAKALAEFLFDDERAVVRVDMSEYGERHTVARMTGAPPGYVGYEEGGSLTEAVRRRPFSVLLLDEVEKAHPEVLNVLLQVLDDGRLTDGHGRTVDFRNTIVIMTSNLGGEVIAGEKEPLGFTNGDDEQAEAQELIEHTVQRELRRFFRPEFLNRLDEIVVFRQLSREDIRRIVDIQIQHVRSLLASRELQLEISDAARDQLAAEGYDPQFGARPLKRVVQKRVQNPLALKLLQNAFEPGETVLVDVAKGEFTFTAVKPAVVGA